MSAVQFKVERMHRFDGTGNLKAFADVSVNNAVIIKGIRVLNGKKGMFVSMPQEQGKDDKWYDQVICRTEGVHQEFEDEVIQHYNQAL